MRFAERGSRALPGPGERVLVAGLGISGEAAARRLLALGADVVVADSGDGAAVAERADRLVGATIRLGREDPADLAGCGLVVASPGVRPSAPILEAAGAAGIPIWSEVELAWRLARVPVLGVTGTNGKTTTTAMLVSALEAAGRRAVAAGNIGHPLCDAVVEDHDVVVAELSSFQLHNIHSFWSPVAIVLNLAPDHLDWHGSMKAYAAAKARILENQTEDDAAVLHRDCSAWLRGARARRIAFAEEEVPEGGAGVRDGWIVVPEGRVVPTSALRARGRPNLSDAIAAAAAACAFGAPVERVGEALERFRPERHRMEMVAEHDGVTFIDDSKATNPHATLAALAGIEGAVLIAGGRNKGLDLAELASGARGLRGVVAIGEAASEIEEAFGGAGFRVERAGSMEEAVARAAAMAAAGDTVLLSPACASFDMFADYRARGDAFREAVGRLGASKEVSA